MYYQKKPVFIQAIQWTGNNLDDVAALMHPSRRFDLVEFPDDKSIGVITSGGPMIARIGTWIIRNADGEISLCKPTIFAATYKPVEPTPNQETPACRQSGQRKT